MGKSDEDANRAEEPGLSPGSGGSSGSGLPPKADQQFREYFTARQEAAERIGNLLQAKDMTECWNSITYRCFMRATDLAMLLGNLELDTVHLVVALATDADAQQILHKAGYNPDSVIRECTPWLQHQERDWKIPRTEPPSPSRDICSWVREANKLAEKRPVPEYRSIDVKDLLDSVPKERTGERPSAETLLLAKPGPTLHAFIKDELVDLEKRIDGKFDGLDRKLDIAHADREEKHRESIDYFKTIHGAVDKVRDTVELHRSETAAGFDRVSALVNAVGVSVAEHRRETASGFMRLGEQSRNEFQALSTVLQRVDETTTRTDLAVQRIEMARLSYALLACALLIAVGVGGTAGIYLQP